MSTYYTVGNMRNDPPEQRAWVRNAAALGIKLSALRLKPVPPRVVVGVVMLAADYLWEQHGAEAHFADFRAEPFVECLATRFFGPRAAFELHVLGALWFEDLIRSNPKIVESLPIPFVEETEDAIMIPMPSERGPRLRDEIRSASKKAWARSRRRKAQAEERAVSS